MTNAPGDDEARALAARLGAGRRRLTVVMLGVAVLLGVGGIAFVAGQREPRPEPAPAAPIPLAAAPAPPALPEVRVPRPPTPPRAAETPPLAAPGFLLVAAQPWGKLYVDGKFVVDVEEPRRIPLPPGSHAVRLQNGKKSRTWTVEIESGKTETRRHSFIEE